MGRWLGGQEDHLEGAIPATHSWEKASLKSRGFVDIEVTVTTIVMILGGSYEYCSS